MKILMINGSPKENGNTATALNEMRAVFENAEIEVEIFCVGKREIRGCIGCGSCHKNGRCVFDDEVNELAKKLEACDGVVIGSPVYYAAPNATLLALLNRLFYSTRFDKRMKVGAAFAVARRGGTTAAFDVLNKYFTISGMPIASGQYWNVLHGAKPGEVAQDAEGLQNLRAVANNMIFLLRSIALGKEAYGLPEKEAPVRTNFIR